MKKTWFSVETQIIDREDLNIYEKMCLVAIARYVEYGEDLNYDLLASKIGCSIYKLEEILDSLVKKKLLSLVNQPVEDLEPDPDFKPIKFDNVKVETLLDQVIALIDEPISSREAKIILSIANNDIEKIKEKYRIAKRSQLSDKVGVLINELQRKEKKLPTVIKGNSQIDTSRIRKMKAYSQMNEAFKGAKIEDE